MSRDTYNYKRSAIKAARELFYSDTVIEQLHAATTEYDIRRIMKSAREEGIYADED